MANKEDSIHIKIKFDVDEEDKQFVESLSQQIAKADEKEISKQSKQFREGKTDKEVAKEGKIIRNTRILKELRAGPVGTVERFTKAQTSNLTKFVSNPGAFFISGLIKSLSKYGKAAMKGGIYAIIALLIYETVLFLLNELMKPGRALDRRFKRIAQVETLNFYQRTLQEELRHGYQEIRVTTQQGLRGGMSQVNGNFFEFSSSATGILQSSPYRSSQDIYQSQQSVGAITDNSGNPRRRSAFFPGR